MRENRDLRVLLASGWYDMATAFFAAEIALGKNGTVQDRIERTYYQGGYRMYLVKDQAAKLADDAQNSSAQEQSNHIKINICLVRYHQSLTLQP